MIKRGFVIIVVIAFMVNFSLIFSQEKQVKKEDAESCFLKCKVSLKNNDADKAVEYGEKAVSLNGNVSKYYLLLGQAYNLKINKVVGFEKMTYAQKMKEAWEKAVQLDGKNLDARFALTMYYLRAPAFAGGSKEKAKVQGTEILKLNPMMGHSILAEIFLTENNYEKAEWNAKKAFKLHMDFMKKNPKKKSSFNAGVLNNLGYGLIKGKKIGKAIEIFKINVKAYPEYFNVYDSLAEAYMINGEKKLAIKNYKKAIKLNPKRSEVEKRTHAAGLVNLKKLKGESESKKGN